MSDQVEIYLYFLLIQPKKRTDNLLQCQCFTSQQKALISNNTGFVYTQREDNRSRELTFSVSGQFKWK